MWKVNGFERSFIFSTYKVTGDKSHNETSRQLASDCRRFGGAGLRLGGLICRKISGGVKTYEALWYLPGSSFEISLRRSL
jgi:hypothetical protein